LISDVNLFGLSVDVALVTAIVAFGLMRLLRSALASFGMYRWVWHPSLFDFALFAVLWFALAIAASQFDNALALLIG